MISSGKLLLAVLQQTLQTLYPLVSCDEFPLCDRDFLLQAAVLLNKLPLHYRQLLEIAL